MSTHDLKKGRPVEVQMETVVRQGDSMHRYSFQEMGRIVEMNDHYYVRFEETAEDNRSIPVTVKIHPSGRVTVIRTADHTVRMHFEQDGMTSTTYPTPAGVLPLDILTKRLDLVLAERPFAGKVMIDYSIVTDTQKLGDYQLRLRFTT